MRFRIEFGKPLRGWWVAASLVKHRCQPPGMPRGVPAGIIYRCECGSEWTWKPKEG